MILETLKAVSTSGILDHIKMNGRTVAIRADYARDKNLGTVNLRFSDSLANPESFLNYVVSNLSVEEAERIISIFFFGRRVLISHDNFGMQINQADRWCWIEKRTPKRLRISYEMPNAGIMYGWWKYIEINDYAYLTNN